MPNKITHINHHVRTQNDRIDRIAKSALASARISGISVPEGEIWRMASKAVKQYFHRYNPDAEDNTDAEES